MGCAQGKLLAIPLTGQAHELAWETAQGKAEEVLSEFQLAVLNTCLHQTVDQGLFCQRHQQARDNRSPAYLCTRLPLETLEHCETNQKPLVTLKSQKLLQQVQSWVARQRIAIKLF